MKGLTLKEAANRADVTTQRIHQLAAEGRIRFTQTPYGRLFRESDVDRYIAKRQVGRPKPKKAKKKKGAAA